MSSSTENLINISSCVVGVPIVVSVPKWIKWRVVGDINVTLVAVGLFVVSNPDATLEEKRAYARSVTFVLANKYEDNKILKQSEFNLQLSATDLTDQYNTTINDMKKLADGTLDQDTIESYESLARANGYQDIQSFMNDYIPILESQLSRSR